MKRSSSSRKSVSWAPGLELCQVRLFQSEDCPSKAGSRAQHHIQKKNTRMLQDIPPGFEGRPHFNRPKQELSHIPRVTWKCPPKFLISKDLGVAAGEETTEMEAQKQREARTLEAVYPSLSAISPNSLVSREVELESSDDSLTPSIPLIPIEEQEAADDRASNKSTQTQALLPPNTKPTIGLLPHGANDIKTAATAQTAIIRRMAMGNLIDIDLLVKIVNDPIMVKNLINRCQPPVSTHNAPLISLNQEERGLAPQSCPKTDLLVAPLSRNQNLDRVPGEEKTMPKLIARSTSTTPPISFSDFAMGLSSMPADGSLHGSISEPRPTMTRSSVQPADDISGSLPPQLNTIQNYSFLAPQRSGRHASSVVPQAPMAAMKMNSVIKDENYIKDLIRQHGTHKDEGEPKLHVHHNNHKTPSLELSQGIKLREVKRKHEKPCKFFMTAKGCRRGLSCPFQHDLTSNILGLEEPAAKRMSLRG